MHGLQVHPKFGAGVKEACQTQSRVTSTAWIAKVNQRPTSSWRVRKLTFLGIVDWQFLPTADMETAPSIPWFAATRDIKCEQNLAGLAPKGCFISAEAVERVVRQIGETVDFGRPIALAIAPIEWPTALARPICSLSSSDKCE
jgi:hypothetical protein